YSYSCHAHNETRIHCCYPSWLRKCLALHRRKGNLIVGEVKYKLRVHLLHRAKHRLVLVRHDGEAQELVALVTHHHEQLCRRDVEKGASIQLERHAWEVCSNRRSVEDAEVVPLHCEALRAKVGQVSRHPAVQDAIRRLLHPRHGHPDVNLASATESARRDA
ncbi:hypothetical protein EJB05_10609, partial [Eragrostis curvula]